MPRDAVFMLLKKLADNYLDACRIAGCGLVGFHLSAFQFESRASKNLV
jgi:hypothetical protein